MPGLPPFSSRPRVSPRPPRLAVAGVAAVFMLLAAGPAHGATPRAALEVPDWLLDFSASGERIAWLRKVDERNCYSAWRYSFVRGGATRLSSCIVIASGAGGPDDLTLVGKRATWGEWWSGNTVTDWAVRTTTGLGTMRRLEWGMVECGTTGCSRGGTVLAAVAGSEGVTAYATHQVAPEPCAGDFGCPGVTVGSTVRRLVNTSSGPRAETVAGASGTTLLAAAAGRLAARPLPGGSSEQVEIRDATTGALVSSFHPGGDIRFLAMSGNRVAVAVRTPVDERVEWYDAASGASLGSVSAGGTVRALDVSGRRIVYQVRRQIRLVRTDTGRERVLYRAPYCCMPRDVQIEGRRLTWYVSLGGWQAPRTRIYTLVL